jgi:hypothetical protein
MSTLISFRHYIFTTSRNIRVCVLDCKMQKKKNFKNNYYEKFNILINRWSITYQFNTNINEEKYSTFRVSFISSELHVFWEHINLRIVWVMRVYEHPSCLVGVGRPRLRWQGYSYYVYNTSCGRDILIPICDRPITLIILKKLQPVVAINFKYWIQYNLFILLLWVIQHSTY